MPFSRKRGSDATTPSKRTERQREKLELVEPEDVEAVSLRDSLEDYEEFAEADEASDRRRDPLRR